jgi:peroxiredoxin Q/BCP
MAFGPNITLKEGDTAPAFSAVIQGGGKAALKDFKGKHVILYFYPKDNTPGCNKEACGFRDLHGKIEQKNALVLGVSVDSVKSHDKFISKFNLPFTLLSDEDMKIVNAYGVWGRKKFMGREYDGTHRVTFLIDPKGKIQKIWPKVKAEIHPAEVLTEL